VALATRRWAITSRLQTDFITSRLQTPETTIQSLKQRGPWFEISWAVMRFGPTIDGHQSIELVCSWRKATRRHWM